MLTYKFIFIYKLFRTFYICIYSANSFYWRNIIAII
nr:MAG TPA: hypothetical protein [Caudoviricetes sp.]